MHDAVIVAGVRTAIGKAPKGTLAAVRPDDLAALVIREAVARTPGLDPAAIDDVVLGCAIPEGEQGLNLARIAAVRAGLPNSVSAMTVNRYCSSGLQAIAIAAGQIRSGLADICVAGGAESMSRVFSTVKIAPNPTLMAEAPAHYISMGHTAEEVARRFGIGRAEQDAYSLESHRRAAAATAEGRFRDEILPVDFERASLQNGKRVAAPVRFEVDEGIRAETSLEALAKLKPAFGAAGLVTAGNSSQMSDGAAAVVLMSDERARGLGLRPLAVFRGFVTAGCDPEVMGIGPVIAVPKLLERTGVRLEEVDLIELNEAFASQTVYVIRELGLDPAKVNVNGGAIALGHPLGATGARQTVTLMNEAPRRGARYGIVTMCIGGGQGVKFKEEIAMIVKHKGGEWALQSPPASEVFTPEDLSDQQREIRATVQEFVQKEVLPALPAMEAHDFSHNVRLLRQSAELGLAGVEVPEQYGGLGLDKITAAVVFEAMGGSASFTATFGAHTGIGTLPIVFFGNRAQKEKYLPGLATAEKIGAYSLTEPGSGSDALGAKATARLSPDAREWILNGTKQWTTNAGFADLFIVYAKVDGDKFSAFIVERDSPGLTIGREENKMGIRGSSTCSVILEDCRVPVENLLHEVGKGHQIAFNILNIGRFKLGIGVIGGAKQVAGIAARYAQERKQFGKAIAEFPLIQQKLAEMAVRLYAAESAGYRTAALLEEGLSGLDLDADDAGQQSARAIQEFVVECSIMKVLGSEVLDYVVDEAVQIHGGYGFMEEFDVCRAYRDSRINRIFEGTNEINRMLITGDLLKKGLKGQLPLMAAVMGLQNELLSLTPPIFDGATPLEQEAWLVEAGRKIALMVAGLGVQKYQMAVEAEQEFLAGVADMLIDLLAMESAVLRAQKHPSEARRDLAVAFVHDAFGRIEDTARTLLASIDEGDTLRTQLTILRKLTRRDAVNTIALKRRIAQRVLAANGYAVS